MPEIKSGYAVFDEFLCGLQIPESCVLDKPVFKKLFQDASDGKKGLLNAADKACLKADVHKIRWLYTLKPSTINIAPYSDSEREYPEVAILHFELSTVARAERIVHFVNRAIPYPVLLLFTQVVNPSDSNEDIELAISVADKRVNQADKGKWVIEHCLITPWVSLNTPSDLEKAFIQSFVLNDLSFRSFYDLYRSFTERVVALSCASHSGVFRIEEPLQNMNGIQRLEQLYRIERLAKKKSELANKLKKTKQMGKQVELNSQVKKLNEEIAQIKIDL